jgi:V8-like Glu-specific endopeptidase
MNRQIISRARLSKYFVLTTTLITLSACGASVESSSSPALTNSNIGPSDAATARVIYGEDNRLDLYAVNDIKRVALADSTVALISTNDITEVDGTSNLHVVPYANIEGTPLCPSERFRSQSTVAFCSGFLIAPNLIATAGHCIRSDQGDLNDCSTTKIVFGFSLFQDGPTPTSVPTSEVYSCKKIIKREETPNAQDYSVIELDREVPNHSPMKLHSSGDPLMSDQLMVIGHPSGLPTKVADGALIRSIEPTFIRASLDTYAGNSGSAVINVRTLEVEGILVRGEQDFVAQGSCLVSKVCAQDDCRGEDSTRISYVVPYAN